MTWIRIVPSAASFYVQSLPDLHQDEAHPLHIYSGHLSSDPDAEHLPSTTVTAHLFFVLIKARRTADKERILFWFNVRSLSFELYLVCHGYLLRTADGRDVYRVDQAARHLTD